MNGLLVSKLNFSLEDRLYEIGTCCVEVNDKKYHITHSVVGDPSKPSIGVRVTSCDCPCLKTVTLPDNVWEKAQSQINQKRFNVAETI